MGEDPSARVRFDLRFANHMTRRHIMTNFWLAHFLTVDHDGRDGGLGPDVRAMK